MWEVFTFGYLPYYDLKGDQVIFNVVHGAIRLQCPDKCPQEVYELMKKCWLTSPTERIKAAQLETELQDLVKAYETSADPWQQTWGSRGPNLSMDNLDTETDAWLQQANVRYTATPSPYPIRQDTALAPTKTVVDLDDAVGSGSYLPQALGRPDRRAEFNEYSDSTLTCAVQNPLFGVDFSSASPIPHQYTNIPVTSDKPSFFDVKMRSNMGMPVIYHTDSHIKHTVKAPPSIRPTHCPLCSLPIRSHYIPEMGVGERTTLWFRQLVVLQQCTATSQLRWAQSLLSPYVNSHVQVVPFI